MHQQLSRRGTWITGAALAALLLTIIRPAPEGLIPFGMGHQEVRAAPGTAVPKRAKHNLTALKIFNLTLVRIREAYVDPSRINPREMLYSALDSVQFNIPEVLVEANKRNNQVVVVVNDQRQKFSTQQVDSPWRLSGKLKKIFRFIEANMNPGADFAEVEYAAINGMLRTLDPHSVLLDPETAREMNVSTSGHFGGLGIVIRMHKRKLTIVRPMKGTPAYRVGVKRGDHIAKINEEVTENLTLQEAVDRMRGKEGTPVTLWIRRKGAKKDLRFDITRARIRVESVVSKMLDKKVGYLAIKQFSGRTAQEVHRALSRLSAQGARGWVLDLRWNPGGLLEQAIRVADMFVDKGTIVTTVGGREREPRRAQRRQTDTKSPVVVLVNGNSASASEIVAGALKNLNRAIIVGSSTFGKGSVQILYDNSDGSKLKLTIAQYLTPGDRSIQSVGITPDIKLGRMFVPKQLKNAKDQVRLLQPSRTYRESDLDAHLTSRYANHSEKPSYKLNFLYEPKQKRDGLEDDENADPFGSDEPIDDEIVEDFEIRLARDLVAIGPHPSRPPLLYAAKRLIENLQGSEHKKLADALQQLGVDWTAPPKGARSQAALQATILVSPTHNVKAGEEIKLVANVTNAGKGTAYRVHARVRSDDANFDDIELVFGRIDPGQTRVWTSFVKVPQGALNRLDLLKLEFKEALGAQVQVHPIKVRVEAAKRPIFAYAHQLIDDGNGDGLVQKNERFRLRVTIRNNGQGEAKDTTAVLRNASGSGVIVKKGRFEIGKLAVGENKTVEFEFHVTETLKEDPLVVEMTVYDSVLHESVNEKLKYPIHANTTKPTKEYGSIKVVNENSPIFEGAGSNSATIAWAKRGTVFRVTGKLGPWLRVELESRRPGFLRRSDAKRTRKRPTKTTLRPNWQVSPPLLALQIPSYETSTSRYRLTGKATDETHVEDVYIYVSNRKAKINNRKVFYKSNRRVSNHSSLHFNADIPLWPGSNRITVVARENDAVRSAKTLYLYRSDSKAATAPQNTTNK